MAKIGSVGPMQQKIFSFWPNLGVNAYIIFDMSGVAHDQELLILLAYMAIEKCREEVSTEENLQSVIELCIHTYLIINCPSSRYWLLKRSCQVGQVSQLL